MKMYSILAANKKGTATAPAVKVEVPRTPLPIEAPILSLDLLKERTDNFGRKALIGEGSYGRVYYANLDGEKEVAVKKLDISSTPDSEDVFLTQVGCGPSFCFSVTSVSVFVWRGTFSCNVLACLGFHDVEIEAQEFH